MSKSLFNKVAEKNIWRARATVVIYKIALCFTGYFLLGNLDGYFRTL